MSEKTLSCKNLSSIAQAHTYSMLLMLLVDGPHHKWPLETQAAFVFGALAPVWHL
jgi:hypothetical protein